MIQKRKKVAKKLSPNFINNETKHLFVSLQQDSCATVLLTHQCYGYWAIVNFTDAVLL